MKTLSIFAGRFGFLVVLLAIETSYAAVTFNLVYVNSPTSPNTGFFDPVLGPARKASLEAVVADVGSKIGQTATVDIRIAPAELDGTGFIGFAAQQFLNVNAPAAGIFDGEVYRRIVLGALDVSTNTDGVMLFDFGIPNIILSGTPAPGQVYMPDVFRHELTHLLGYGSLCRSNGHGRNNTEPDVYSRFDTFLETSGGQAIINAGGNLLLSSNNFATAYAQGVLFDGPATRAANGGNPLLFYFSDTTHSRNPADVMYVSPAIGFVRDKWSARDIGVLTDLGYIINTNAPVPPMFVRPYISDSNGFTLNLSLRTNQSYRIQASVNLTNWTDLTNFVATTGTLSFRDTSATNIPMRFYRTVTPLRISSLSQHSTKRAVWSVIPV